MTTQNPKDLQAALQRLDATSHAHSGDHQRRFRRLPVRGEARLWPGEPLTKPPAPVVVQVRDISRGGIGVLSNEPITKGHFRRLQLVDSGVTVATLPVFCRYCRKIDDGAFLIGVEFGVEASLMMALGVTAKEVAEGDEAESQRSLSGEFVSPERLLS